MSARLRRAPSVRPRPHWPARRRVPWNFRRGVSFSQRGAQVDRQEAEAPSLSSEGLSALTGRAADVLACLCAGLRDKEIAERLVVSSATVATHVRHISAKLGVSSRLEIVIRALTDGRMREAI